MQKTWQSQALLPRVRLRRTCEHDRNGQTISHCFYTDWVITLPSMAASLSLGQLQEHTGARMEEPQEVRHGNATPRPLLCRLAERVLEGGSIGHRASGAIDEQGAMTMPPPFVQGGALHGAAEALSEEVKEAYRESGAGLTVGRRREPSARQMGQMAASGVTMQNLPQEELHSGDWREHAVAPGGIASRLARADDRFWWQLGRPRCCESAKHGGDTGYHRSPSCKGGDHRSLHTGDMMIAQRRLHPYKLTTYP
jgi:hypothetical protein